MLDPLENRRISFEMNRRKFKKFTSASIFLEGVDDYNAYDYKAALNAFRRVLELEPDNPYACAYYLFAMEDSGKFTVDELSDMAGRWCEAALKNRYHGLDAFAIAYVKKYVGLQLVRGDGTDEFHDGTLLPRD